MEAKAAKYLHKRKERIGRLQNTKPDGKTQVEPEGECVCDYKLGVEREDAGGANML